MSSVPLADAEAPLILALDVGTSSVRAMLFDRLGRAVDGSEEQLTHELRTTPDGGAEADGDALFDRLVACIDATRRRAGDRVGDIAAVGASCFWHSLVGLDASACPITPVLIWADTRSAPQVDALRRRLDTAAIHARTGCVIHSSYWPAKLVWLRETQPELFRRVKRWTSFADFATIRLHGVDETSISMASGTGLLDLQRVAWDPELIEVTGVDPATLPNPVPPDTARRGLRHPYAERWPSLAAIPWFPADGDGACANVGSGATSPERVALTVGTTGAMRIIVPNAAGAPLTIPPDLWAYRLDAQRVVLGAAISNGGKLLAWIADLIRVDFQDKEMALAAAMAPDSHGLTVLPFLAGERSPIWNDRATAVVAGLTLDVRREGLLRAAMESVAYRFALLYGSVRGLAAPRHEIVANGAAILRSSAWLQIMADTLRHPITTLPPTEEASARGAAVLALVRAAIIPRLDAAPDPAAGAGTVDPIPANAAAYQTGRDRQARLEALLYPADGNWDDH